MKKLLIAILIGLGLAGTAYAVNVTVPQSFQKGSIPIGNANGTYNSGFLVAGSNITISTSTTGQISITSTGGSASAGGSNTQLQYNNLGALGGISQLTWSGTLLQNTATTTLASTTISSLTLTQPLSVLNGGTGTTTFQSGSVPYYNGTNLTENNLKFVWDSTNLWLKAPICDFGGQVFNVKCYGAKGDGSTNDTASFNSAISAANTAGGGKVYLPTGNYKLSTSPTFFNNIQMEGVGSSSKVSLATGARLNVNAFSNVSFNNFAVDGNAQVLNDYGIYINGSSYVSVTNMTLYNMGGFAVYVSAGANSTSSNITITNNTLVGKGNNDVIGGGKSINSGAVTDVTITNNQCTQDARIGANYQNCFDIVAVQNLIYNNNVVNGRVQFGLEQSPNTMSQMANNVINPALGQSYSDMLVTSTLGTTSTSSTISLTGNTIKGQMQVQGTTTLPLLGLNISGNNITSTSTQNSIEMKNVSNGSVTGNVTTGGAAGIYFATSTDFSVSGNTVSNSVNCVRDDSSNTTIQIDPSNHCNSISSTLIIGGNPGVSLTVGTTQNVTGLSITQNNTTNNPDAGVFTNTGTGNVLKVVEGNSNNAPSVLFVDSNQVAPAGNYTIGNHSDALSFYRGVLGVSAAEKFEINSSQVTSGTLGVKSAANGVFAGPNMFLFSTAASSFINNGFNFGIGSSSPVATLSVEGTSSLPTTDIFRVASSSNTTYLTVAANGSTTLSTLGTGCVAAVSGSLYTTGVACGTGSGGSGNSAFTIGNALIYNATSTDLVGIGTITPTTTLFVQGKGGTDLLDIASSTGTSLIHLTQAGSVGIGTSAPITALALNSGQISAPGGTNNNPAFAFTSQISSGFYLASAGNLAFSAGGTQTLQIDSQNFFGPGANTYMLKNLTGDSTTQPIFIPDRSTTNTGFAAGTAGNINVIVGGKEVARWTATGFGIGSSTPTAMLVSQGFSGSTTPIFIAASSTGANYLTILSNGNVGIGSSTPTANLVVQTTAGQTTAALVVASSTGDTLFSITPCTSCATTYNLIQGGTTTQGSLFVVNSIGDVFVNHVSGSTTLPTIATSTGVGIGAGTSASLESGSTDLGGLIHFKTTNAPAVNATVVTVSLSRTYAAAPICITSPGNSTSTVDSTKYYSSTTANSLLILSSVATGLTATTTYDIKFVCVGKLGG